MISRSWAWSPDPYSAGLPPPLCFTVPAGQKPGAQAAPLLTSGAMAISMRKPNLMMDPSDQSTWQRPYRFSP